LSSILYFWERTQFKTISKLKTSLPNLGPKARCWQLCKLFVLILINYIWSQHISELVATLTLITKKNQHYMALLPYNLPLLKQPIRTLHSIINWRLNRFLIGRFFKKIKLTPKRFKTASPNVHYFGYHVLEISKEAKMTSFQVLNINHNK
jgi:hypothetical protein